MRTCALVFSLALAIATASLSAQEPVPPAPPADVATETELAEHPVPPMSPETRAQREKELAEARVAYEETPEDAEALIWLGRRAGYLGRYRESIEIFSEGIRLHPADARMWRHRGHRWITLRKPDLAIHDLQKAAELVRGKPDEIEPDGLPNARNIPTSTLQSNIWYHLGLAHYIQGDFASALAAYREGIKVSKNPDGVVSMSFWLYMTLRRLGQNEEAEEVLQTISSDMDVIENVTYLELLLMARGEIDAAELEGSGVATVDGTTVHNGIATWHLCNGEPAKARPLFERIIAGPQWAAFGYIVAEAELGRKTQWE